MKPNAATRFRKLFILFTAATGFFISGCATPQISVNYAPSSAMSVDGSLSVSDFNYLPSLPDSPKPVLSNQIRNTGIGNVIIDRDVSKFVRDAVFTELRFVGIKTNDKTKILSGDIEEFLIDDLGSSVDWTLRIKYLLTDGNSKVLYDSIKETQRNTNKFANVFGALNETIKINIEQLLSDSEFTKAIN